MSANTGLSEQAWWTRGDRLTIGLGTTIAIWLVLYLACMPVVAAPPLLIAALVLLCLVGGGFAAGRFADRSPRDGIPLGLVITAINLLILASLGSGEGGGELLTSVLPWIGGFLVAALILCSLGAWLGQLSRPGTASPQPRNWTGRLAAVVAFLTLILINAGGIVTGMDAGMAVPDWLTTFGIPMMFYPLRAMQQSGDVFAEHFHRLWGLLVGLSVILLTVHLWRVDPRRWVRWLVLGVLLAVIIQGVLGGARVTEDSLPLAMVHGVFGQIIFATIVMLAMFTTARWHDRRSVAADTRSRTDRRLVILLVIVMLVQITLGALYRHLQAHAEVSAGGLAGSLHAHIAGGVLVLLIAYFVGARAAALRSAQRPIAGSAVVLMSLVTVQFLLGFVAMAAVAGADAANTPWQLAITTSHQVIGALLLATAASLAVWTYRLTEPADEAQPVEAAALTS